MLVKTVTARTLSVFSLGLLLVCFLSGCERIVNASEVKKVSKSDVITTMAEDNKDELGSNESQIDEMTDSQNIKTENISFEAQKAGAPAFYGISLCMDSEKSNSFVLDHIDELTETIVYDPSFFLAENRDLGDLYILSPFHLWKKESGGYLEFADSFWYPIASRGKIIAVITIFEMDGVLHYNVSSQLTNELNLILTDNQNRILVEHESPEGQMSYYFADTNSSEQQHSESENIFINLSGRFSEK